MSNNVTLKPCPFCGGEASFYRKSGSYGYYPSKTGVQCGNGDCLVQPKVSFDDEDYDWEKRKHVQLDSKAEAIAAWNTRASQQSVPNSVVEALRRVTSHIERYEGQTTFTIADWQLEELDRLTNLQQSGQTEAELLREAHRALYRADQFVTNGIEFGYIRMPDEDSKDAALEVPSIIGCALQKFDLQFGPAHLNATQGEGA